MQKGEIFLGRNVIYVEKFPGSSTNDFQSYRQAEARLKDLGYIVGSMSRDEPIGFADEDQFKYVAKWYNIGLGDRKKLDGIMVSSDFRNGEVTLAWFNPPKF